MAVHPPPTDVTAVQSGVTSIIVSWAAVNGSTGYMIFYNSSGGHSSNVTVEDQNTTSYTLTGLYNGQIYSLFVSSMLRVLLSRRVFANTVGLSKFTNDCIAEVDTLFHLQFQMLQPSAVFHLHPLELLSQ